ncbi:MAG: hypothetical protein G3I10_06560, partial [Ferrovum sp.]|nr:hypothetical protein [Ferrovum sp.]
MIASCEEDILEVGLRRIVSDVLQHPETPVVVLLPHAALVDLFQKRLAESLPSASSLYITTLARWAAEQPPIGRIVPEIERLSLIFNALRERCWFEQEDRWVLAREALVLVDELTRWGFTMPQDPESFSEQLALAYATHRSTPLQFEARLVHDLWWVLNQNPLELSPTMAYQQQLTRLAALPHRGSCYVVAAERLIPAELHCLTVLARGMTLVRIECSEPGREGDHCTRALRAAWDGPACGTLSERAQTLARHMPISPFVGRVVLVGMESIEREAHEGALQVRQWLTSGCRNIAIVAQDRVVSRRLRAMLERQGVAVYDESGWTFSTTAASTVVMRWLDLVRSGGYYRHLQDLLHSPYLCGDWPAEKRERAASVLENQMLRSNWISDLGVLIQHLEGTTSDQQEGVAVARDMLGRLQQAAQLFQPQALRFAQWLARLMQSLEICGIITGLTLDAAGRQLLGILNQLGQDAERIPGKFTLAEWVRSLDLQFEAASFMEEAPRGPVCMTQLSMTRLRSFGAVLVLGADADHLPFISLQAYFGDVVRAALGLPTRQDILEATRRDLIELISRAGTVKITWRNEVNGEHNRLAPLLQRLDVFHQIAWGKPLLSMRSPLPATPAPAFAPGMPAPRLQSSHVPLSLSASAHNRLLACPYQFFAAAVLRLDDDTTIQETVDKRDYGQLIHEVLYQFHQATPQVSALTLDQAIARLTSLTRSAFGKRKIPDEEMRAWGLRWESRIPSYVAWAAAWEQDGWCWSEGEKMHERLLGAHTPGQVVLKGKLDRMDRRRSSDGEEVAILDYKLKSFSGRIAKDIAQGEDVQLAVYTLLADQPIARAAYLLLDEG